MARAPKGGKKVDAKIPDLLYEFVQNEVKERGVDITTVIIDSLALYRDYKLNPDKKREEIRQAVREDPTILKDEIAAQVREQLQQQLIQIFGEKFRS
jgi:lipase chaperone LimK